MSRLTTRYMKRTWGVWRTERGCSLVFLAASSPIAGPGWQRTLLTEAHARRLAGRLEAAAWRELRARAGVPEPPARSWRAARRAASLGVRLTGAHHPPTFFEARPLGRRELAVARRGRIRAVRAVRSSG